MGPGIYYHKGLFLAYIVFLLSGIYSMINNNDNICDGQTAKHVFVYLDCSFFWRRISLYHTEFILFCLIVYNYTTYNLQLFLFSILLKNKLSCLII